MSKAQSYLDEINRGYLSTRKLRFKIVLHLMEMGSDYVSNMGRIFDVNKKTVENICKRLESVGLLKSYWDMIDNDSESPPKTVKKYMINSDMSFEDHEEIKNKVEDAFQESFYSYPF